MTREECLRILASVIEPGDGGEPGVMVFPGSIELCACDGSGEDVFEAIKVAVRLLRND